MGVLFSVITYPEALSTNGMRTRVSTQSLECGSFLVSVITHQKMGHNQKTTTLEPLGMQYEAWQRLKAKLWAPDGSALDPRSSRPPPPSRSPPSSVASFVGRTAREVHDCQQQVPPNISDISRKHQTWFNCAAPGAIMEAAVELLPVPHRPHLSNSSSCQRGNLSFSVMFSATLSSVF